MDIILISAICIVSAVLAKVIQPTNRDISAALSITTVIIAAGMVVREATRVLSGIQNTINSAGIGSQYISVAFRVLGICYICEIAASCCRDCGETALGGIIEISGRVAISLICLPLFEKFIEVVKSILEL